MSQRLSNLCLWHHLLATQHWKQWLQPPSAARRDKGPNWNHISFCMHVFVCLMSLLLLRSDFTAFPAEIQDCISPTTIHSATCRSLGGAFLMTFLYGYKMINACSKRFEIKTTIYLGRDISCYSPYVDCNLIVENIFQCKNFWFHPNKKIERTKTIAMQKMSCWWLRTAIFEEQETSFENILKASIKDRYNCL